MHLDERSQTVIKMIEEQIRELSEIEKKVSNDEDTDIGFEDLERWKQRTCELLKTGIHPQEANKLDEMPKVIIFRQPLRSFNGTVKKYKVFLMSLKEEVTKHPDSVLSESPPGSEPETTVSDTKSSSKNAVFIIHGHDELNLRKLREILQKRWKLETIVMLKEPGAGRTLIEKFEEEAKRATYAFALLTPDDVIKASKNGDEYVQARPNVIFELGWFFSHIGRNRVCILSKKGTQIHSDLHGISRIDFLESVDERIAQIENELKEAGIVGQEPCAPDEIS